MDAIKDLLLNVLLIILPVFLYQTFFLDRSEQFPTRNRFAIFFFGSVSILLCMTFPVTVAPGYFYDLRAVPLLIGVLYGGYGVGLALGVFLIVYRWFLGGSGFFLVLMMYPVILAAAFYFVARFQNYGRKQKYQIASGLAFASSAFVSLGLMFMSGQHESQRWAFFLAFSLIQALTMWSAVHLAENMREKTIMRHEIQRAEKLHLLGELAASITHEIRNPMTVVRGFLQLLLDNQIPEEKKQMYLKLGIEELDRSESIISTYLSYARPQDQQMVPVDVNERITHATAIISSYATLRNVEIDQETESGLTIMADPEKIIQVLINLIKNGIEAMPNGGLLQIRAYRQRHVITIVVKDTGMGMTEEQASRLGNAFFSTKDTGTGLGLSVSYQILRSINGKIAVHSETNKGTQFIITIPAHSA